MKRVTTFFIAVLLTTTSFAAFDGELADGTKCATLLAERAMTSSEKFALRISQHFDKKGMLPKAHSPTYKWIQGGEGTPAVKFKAILEEYGVTREQWLEVQGIAELSGRFGASDFEELVKASELDEALKKVFIKIHKAVAKSLKKVLATLFVIEEELLDERKRFMSKEELAHLLKIYTGEARFTLADLGFANMAEYRQAFLNRTKSSDKKVQKVVISGFVELVKEKNQILEDENEIAKRLSDVMGITQKELMSSFFGEGRAFASIEAMVEQAMEDRPSAFKKVIDRRVFTQEKREEMLEAIRNASEIIVFKLAENQDLKDFESINALAESLNAPIIVAPAFTEIGLIPDKLGWLFENPNVHFLVDRGIQITRNFHIVDFGFHDKYINPLTPMREAFGPTDRVLLFHPRVLAESRHSGNYDTHSGYTMTTGSMSDPAYWGKWRMSMNTDIRAQIAAEQNRGLVVLSRRYQNPKLGGLLGSAMGIAPRRVKYTDERYGNPSGLFDLGTIYSNDGPVKVKSIPALVLGDIHLGATDPAFMKATQELLVSLDILEKNPDFGQAGTVQREYREGDVHLGAIVLHDLIDGTPNNGHTLDRLITRALMDERGELEFENHFKMAAAWLKQQCALLPNTKFVIPVDNHGSDWLKRKLEGGDLTRGHRPKELPIILRSMLDAATSGTDPYKRAFQYLGVDTDQVLFMGNADNFRVGVELDRPNGRMKLIQGVEVGQHGHMGKNGARSISLKDITAAYGPSVSGHYHSSSEHGNGVQVGTGTNVRQGYHRGPGNSDASVALVYSDTAVQLLRMERGSFVPNADAQEASAFFPSSEFPRVQKHKFPPEGRTTTDQFRSRPPAERDPRNE